MKKVAILAVNHGALFELGCAIELFGLPRPEYPDWYRCEVVTFDSAVLSYTAGVQLQVQKIASLAPYDMLVVPSWHTDDSVIDGTLLQELQWFHAQEKCILSFCSGSFLLGYAGLLNGRRSTTHWRYADKFRRLFPQVSYAEDVLYVYDGQIGCSAGSAAGLDLGIEVIREDFGYRTANQVARRLVLSAHRNGGQSQFVETPVLQTPGKFSQALDWSIQNLPRISNISVIADRARMSRRSFDRKFRATVGISPNDWLIDQKLLAARALLEEAFGNIEKVADAAGFGSAVTMRYHFQRKYGITPTQYRDQFSRGKA